MKLKTEFDFDAAHRLVGYNGKCSRLHGHTWKVEVEIFGDITDSIGMMFDFTSVKKIRDLFDHKTILKECIENEELMNTISKVCGADGLYLMSENPTAENLANEICIILKQMDALLHYRVTIWESPQSSCEVVR